ncbi:MAG: hypothetical protein L3J69_15130 [Desulfobacula sp.]|nr:hypothetical protein [Desulfobacula sp.]
MDNFLSASSIAKELNTGKATIKFILNRFKNWIPSELSNGQSVYPHHALTIIAIAQQKLDMGILPSQIEEQLQALSTSKASCVPKPIENGDIRISRNGFQLLKSVINDIGEQQRRIAKAHEKRADAEERKAAAIEKRAEAEEKKAQAMNNIANALQQMNQIRSTIDPAAQQIAHQAVSIIAEDEQAPSLENPDVTSLNLPDDLIGDLNDMETKDLIKEIHLDDLSELIDDQASKNDLSFQLDDLSLLIDAVSAPEEKRKLPPEMDDLSKLLGTDSADSNESIAIEMDDLSLLIDSPGSQNTQQEDLDDLSLLITTKNFSQKSDTGISDVPNTDEPDITASKMDDLSKLIDKKGSTMDDMDKNTEDKSVPEIKIDVSPDQDLGKYKAAIMQIIIGFKTDGINVEKATDILNKNNIKTLSGKPQWTQKAISQIFKFIESAT